MGPETVSQTTDMEVERADDEFTPVFRAVVTPRQRRGVRLELIYWQTLKIIAESERVSLGEAMENAAQGAADVGNFASVLRVHVARWLSERLRKLEALTRLESINPIVQASPAPTFVIGTDKRIVLYNRPLLNLIQNRFPNVRSDVVYKGLKLSVDMQIDQIFERLKLGERIVVTSGFAIGIDGRRMRGAINFVLAPTHKQSMLIAYVVDIADSGA